MFLAALFVLFAATCIPTESRAAGPNGIYIAIDPYQPAQLKQLTDAASRRYCMNADPFCTAADGIFLHVDWCRFQGYTDAQAPGNGTKDFSCHYYVGFTPTNRTSPVQILTAGDDTHQCGLTSTPTYDECMASDLSKALAAIVSINKLRAANHSIPPLRLSLGLMAGFSTPEFVLREENQSGTGPLAIPFHPFTGPGCVLEPQVWLADYTSKYLAAYDEFLSYIHTTMAAAGAGGSPITLVKVTPLNSVSLEYDLPGPAKQMTQGITDPNKPDVNDDLPISCSSGAASGADQWIATYKMTGQQSSNSVIRAMEQTFGSTVGNLYAELTKLGEPNFGISVATNDVEAYPMINCGNSGAGAAGTNDCGAQTNFGNGGTVAADQWSLFYLAQHVSDLFSATGNSVAQIAAKAAANAVGTAPFTLTPSQLYVNTTNLTDPTTSSVPCPNFKGTNRCAMVSQASISCGLNETVDTAHTEQTFTLDSTLQQFPGIGTQLGVQTSTLLDVTPNYCMPAQGATTLFDIFKFAIDNGTQFIEMTNDISQDPNCWSYMRQASVMLVTPPSNVCLY